MNVNELAKEVHANAVSHGWWDGDRNASEIVALIHSEWSEALEEARAGRPMQYVIVDEVRGGMNNYIEKVIYEKGVGRKYDEETKKHNAKPEGIAIELIDGCIRILDAFEFFHVHFNEDKTLDDLMDEATRSVLPRCDNISDVVAYLHYETSMLFVADTYENIKGMGPATFLLGALGVALAWVRQQGLDPVKILMEKHAYNKTRPYKHGKKF